MKNFLLVFLLASLGWAQTPTQKIVATATPALSVVSDGITLVIDGGYTWDQHAAKFKFGTPEFKQARLEVIAYADAVAAAQAANKKGDYVTAESISPEYVTRAFYGLSVLRTLMGGKRKADRSWGSYPADAKGVLDSSKVDPLAIQVKFNYVQKWVNGALASGKTKDSQGNDVALVQSYLDAYAKGLLKNILKP